MSETRVNIASYLIEMARRQPATDALLTAPKRDTQGKLSYTHTTYKQLRSQAEAMAHGLTTLGIDVGTRTAICLRPGVEFFAVTFALFMLGAIPVLIDPGIGLRNFGRCLEQAQPEAFVGIPLAHGLRRLLGWARRSIRICISSGSFGGISLKKVERLGDSGAPVELGAASDAAILFTSGSTGPAKGVGYTHENFNAQIEALKQTYQIQPGEIDLATFPLFALFGPALGMTTVLPEMDFTRPGFVEPRNIIDPIQQLGITNLFGSPALIERVGRFGEAEKVKLPSLKRVISAGAPASPPVLERFSKMLSAEAQIFTPYGATEALPVSSIGSREILAETRTLTNEGKGVCVGKPVGNISVRVVPVRDDVIGAWSDDLSLPAYAVGEIAVSGPAVTRDYFGRPDATALAKVPIANGSIAANGTPQSHGTFYHRMGDVGYFDTNGRLWFCGRKSQRVQLREGDLYSMPVEAIFNTHPHVRRSALVGVYHGDQMRPVVCIELESSGAAVGCDRLRRELLELAAKHEQTRQIENILFHANFPVDIRHNAKINREKLALWAQRKMK